MSTFPDTSTTLLAKLAARETGDDQAAWFRFFALYRPVMLEFARLKGAGEDAEDLVQEVFANLAKVFREGRYAREKGTFRAYLAKMLRNGLISRFRRNSVRPECVAFGETGEDVVLDKSLQIPPAVYSGMDDEERWKMARRRTAVEHVLGKTALSAQSRQIYRRLMETGDNCAVVAREMGVSAATVRQVKSRVSRMIVAFEKTLG